MFDVKVWESETDLRALYTTIKEKVVQDGLVWAEGESNTYSGLGPV